MADFNVTEQAKEIGRLLDEGNAQKAAELFRQDLREHPESGPDLLWQTRVADQAHVGADLVQIPARGAMNSILPDFEIQIAQKDKAPIPVAHGGTGNLEAIEK